MKSTTMKKLTAILMALLLAFGGLVVFKAEELDSPAAPDLEPIITSESSASGEETMPDPSDELPENAADEDPLGDNASATEDEALGPQAEQAEGTADAAEEAAESANEALGPQDEQAEGTADAAEDAAESADEALESPALEEQGEDEVLQNQDEAVGMKEPAADAEDAGDTALSDDLAKEAEGETSDALEGSLESMDEAVLEPAEDSSMVIVEETKVDSDDATVAEEASAIEASEEASDGEQASEPQLEALPVEEDDSKLSEPVSETTPPDEDQDADVHFDPAQTPIPETAPAEQFAHVVPVGTLAVGQGQLFLYAAADVNAAKLLSLVPDSLVRIISQDGSWVQVDFEGTIGFVPLINLVRNDPDLSQAAVYAWIIQNEEVKFGDIISLGARVTGLDDLAYTVIWQHAQMDKHGAIIGNWVNQEGATSLSYSFVLSEHNARFAWRIAVFAADVAANTP